MHTNDNKPLRKGGIERGGLGNPMSKYGEMHGKVVWFLDGVVFRVEEDFIAVGVVPNGALELRDGVAHGDAHAGWSADEDACSSSEVFAELAESVGYIGAAVFGAPSVLLLDCGGQEGEAHEILLEFGRGGGETEVESLDVVGVGTTGRLYKDIWVDGVVPGFNGLGDVEVQISFPASCR